MATITLKGNEIHTVGALPAIGTQAPEFKLVKNDLSVITLSELKGKRVVLNIFPSLDTGICGSSVRNFNKYAADLNNTQVLCISRDLPFAQSRFCGAEGIENVITCSDFRRAKFGQAYGLEIIDGPMEGLLSRVVIVLDESGKVLYSDQVPEIAQEPDYPAALSVLK